MTTFTVIDEGVIWKNPYPGSQSRVAWKGYSVCLGGGEILHTMRVGQARNSPDARCMLTRSSDAGRTWSPPVAVNIPNGADDKISTLNMTRLDHGTIRGLAQASHVVSPEDPRYKPDNGGWVGSTGYITESDDSGRTWSKGRPAVLASPPGGFSVAGSCPYTCDDGEWIMIVEPMFTESVETLHHEAAVVFSRDEGKTWGQKAMMAQDRSRRVFYFDPRMARLKDGHFVGVYWTHDTKTDQSLKATINWSQDGHSWSEPTETPFWGSLTLPLVLSDGRLLAVFNHRRNPQGNRVVLSEDGGKTWDMENETILWDQAARRVTGERASASEERAWEGSLLTEMFTSFDYGCPHPIELDDGTVFITYYATELDHIMHQRFIRLRVD